VACVLVWSGLQQDECWRAGLICWRVLLVWSGHGRLVQITAGLLVWRLVWSAGLVCVLI